MRQNPRQLSSGRWQADIQLGAGKRTRPTFRTKAAALKALHDAIDVREAGGPAQTIPTFEEFLPTATAAIRPRVEASTWSGYQRNLKLHITPRLGSTRLDRIDPAAQQRFVGDLLAGGMSATMVHRVYSTLSVVLKMGARHGYCAAPTKTILSLPRPERFTPTYASVGDIEVLADRVDPRFRALILLCGYAGPRLSEALALHPASINWAANTIEIRATLERGTPPWRKHDTKGHQRRTIQMPLRVREALAEHIASVPDAEWIFHRDGRPVDHSWFDHYIWRPARRRSALELRFHDLRHASAAVMAQLAGWSPQQVCSQLGHVDAAFTLKVYGQFWPEDQDEARGRIDLALAEALREAKKERERV